MKTCSIEGCKEKHYGRGLCNKCYMKQYNEKYYQDNKEYHNKWMKKYNEDNKESMAKQQKQYNEDNREGIAEYQRQYDKTPKGKASIKAGNHNRRLLTKDLTKEIIQQVYKDNIKKFGTLTCYLCFKPIVLGDKRLKDSLEHLTPITRKGNNDFENLGIAHQSCNSKKGTKTLEEWKALK